MQRSPAPGTPALAVRNVTKIYSQWQRGSTLAALAKSLLRPHKKEVRALDNISLTVQPGEFVAYAGANGAGKSTTVKILSGILQPTAGAVQVLGLDPAKQRVKLMQRAGVLFGNRSELWWDYPLAASFEWKKRVWNIDVATYTRMLRTVTDMLELGPLLQTFARELSLGQRMRADLGMVLLHNPEILFLDEPTLGLDVLAKKQLIAFLRHQNAAEGTTILVTSHDMDDLQQMANRIVLLSKGKVAFDGSFAELRESHSHRMAVRVVTKNGAAPEIPSLRLEKAHNHELVYSFNPAKTPINQVLGAVATLPDIEDIEIKKTPIEDVIAGLYQSWGAL